MLVELFHGQRAWTAKQGQASTESLGNSLLGAPQPYGTVGPCLHRQAVKPLAFPHVETDPLDRSAAPAALDIDTDALHPRVCACDRDGDFIDVRNRDHDPTCVYRGVPDGRRRSPESSGEYRHLSAVERPPRAAQHELPNGVLGSDPSEQPVTATSRRCRAGSPHLPFGGGENEFGERFELLA